MENTSDLEQLNRYLEAAQGSYEIPPLESSTPAESLLEQIVNRILEALKSIFPEGAEAPDAQTIEMVGVVLLGSIAIILLVAALLWLYRQSTKHSESNAARAWPTPTLTASETVANSEHKELSLAAWVRLRWKIFLAKNNLLPSLTPAEALNKIGKADRTLIHRLNESMFWDKAQSLTQGQWEAEFERLEKEVRE